MYHNIALSSPASVSADGDNNSQQSSWCCNSDVETSSNATEPTNRDIICSKDKTFAKHPGNRKFREFIESVAQKYCDASSRSEKMKMTRDIVRFIQTQHGARFLKQESTSDDDDMIVWVEINQMAARDKVSHALRFAARRLAKRAAKASKKQQLSGSDRSSQCSSPFSEQSWAGSESETAASDSNNSNTNIFQRQQKILENMHSNMELQRQMGMNLSSLLTQKSAATTTSVPPMPALSTEPLALTSCSSGLVSVEPIMPTKVSLMRNVQRQELPTLAGAPMESNCQHFVLGDSAAAAAASLIAEPQPALSSPFLYNADTMPAIPMTDLHLSVSLHTLELGDVLDEAVDLDHTEWDNLSVFDNQNN